MEKNQLEIILETNVSELTPDELIMKVDFLKTANVYRKSGENDKGYITLMNNIKDSHKLNGINYHAMLSTALQYLPR